MRIPDPKPLPLPVVYLASGLAISYYGYSFFISAPALLYALLILLIIALSFFKVLTFYPSFRSICTEKLCACPNKALYSVRQLSRFTLAVTVGFVLGFVVRHSVPLPAQTGLPVEKVIAVSGILREDPRSLQRQSGIATLKLQEASAQGGVRTSAKGSLPVFFPPETVPTIKEFGRGAAVYADGILSHTDRGYLFRASSVHIVKPAPPIEQFRTSLRMKLLAKIAPLDKQGNPPVWSSLASAFLLGVRDDLDSNLTNAFFNAGVAYILALSGMHLAIISAIVAFLLRRPLGMRRALIVGMIFIVGYVFIAGSQPSLVRAALMYIIGSCAVLGFLKRHTLAIVSMAFVIQLVFQSEAGLSLSFILSYAALIGMITLGKTLHGLFKGRLPELLNHSLSVSLAAFIVTAPIVVFYFGALKPIGIITSLFILPLASLFMALSLAALAGSFFPPLWNIFDPALTLLYRTIESIVVMAARVPGFSFSNPAPVLLASALLCIALVLILKHDDMQRKRIASFT